MGLPRTARFVFGLSTALAALSIAVSLTQPSSAATGVAVGAGAPPAPAAIAAPPTTLAPPTTTTTVPAPPRTVPPTTVPTTTPTRAPAPHVTAPPAPPTTVFAATGGRRESCGWSWDATHFDDGSLNEVTILLDAPRRPNSPVTMTAKPGASAMKSFATTTDANGQATMKVALSNDKRDWTLGIGAQFPGSSCDARSFTIAY